MRENRLRTLLNEGKPTIGTRVQSTWPTVTEMVGRSGQFDYVEFLAEYAPYNLHDLDNMGRAIELSPNFCGMIKMEQSAQWHLAVRAMSAGIQNLLFTDVRSGRSMDRPGLEALLAYARKGDMLTVVRLDRLGRSLAELLATVALLKERGIELVSLEERIDTGSAAGELVFHVFSAIAHFERRMIAERTRDGIAAARAEGRKPGRRPLDPEKLQAAVTLIRSGLSPSKAACQVGLGRSTLYRELALMPEARRQPA